MYRLIFVLSLIVLAVCLWIYSTQAVGGRGLRSALGTGTRAVNAVVAISVLHADWLTSDGLLGVVQAARETGYPVVVVVPRTVQLPEVPPDGLSDVSWLHAEVDDYGEHTAAIVTSRALVGRELAEGVPAERLILLRVLPDEERETARQRASADLRALQPTLLEMPDESMSVLFAAGPWVRFRRARFTGALCANRPAIRVLASRRGGSGRWKDLLSLPGVRLLTV